MEEEEISSSVTTIQQSSVVRSGFSVVYDLHREAVLCQKGPNGVRQQFFVFND